MFGSGAPFVIHRAKPPERLKKLLAKGCFQPGEIFALRRPFTAFLGVRPARRAHGLPLELSLAHLDTMPDEIARLSRQREVRALAARGFLAKWTMPLTDHAVNAIGITLQILRAL